jgi:hypothetical protein
MRSTMRQLEESRTWEVKTAEGVSEWGQQPFLRQLCKKCSRFVHYQQIPLRSVVVGGNNPRKQIVSGVTVMMHRTFFTKQGARSQFADTQALEHCFSKLHRYQS